MKEGEIYIKDTFNIKYTFDSIFATSASPNF